MVSMFWVAVLATVVVPAGSFPVKFSSSDEFKSAREKLIQSEHCMGVGGRMSLTDKEKILNQFIIKEKRALIENSRLNRTGYIPAMSFFLSKPMMESTPIFKIIKDMPKGAVLHLHDVAIGSLDWIVKNATYRNNVYMCLDQDNFVILNVSLDPSPNNDCVWKLVQTERQKSGNITDFDLWLKRNLSMLTTDPLKTYHSLESVWNRFDKYFTQIRYIQKHVPFMRDYYRQALEDFRNDNVQYIEVRSSMSGHFFLNGTVNDAERGLQLFKEVTEEFVKEHPDFTGAKFIMSSQRSAKVDKVLAVIKTSVDLYTKYPNFFLGFDLVGQEDPNYPLSEFTDALLSPSQQNPPVFLPYYFHAAETTWQGTAVDYNLVDALLLNTTRIGHGYGLAKHPKLIELVKSRNVAVEVSPLSNQILGLVKDLRNHPAAPLLAENVPVVICSDDPMTWEALPLSHDMYVAFMDFVGADSGLGILKQLVWNSIEYSSLNATEKPAALNLLQSKWDKFIDDSIIKWGLTKDIVVDPVAQQCAPVTTMVPPTPTHPSTKGNSAATENPGKLVAVIISIYAIFIHF